MDAVALMLAVYQSEYSRCVPAILSSADCRLVFALRPKTTAYRAVYASVSTAASVRYDTRCRFNVRSNADMSQLNLPHGTDN